MDLRDIEGATLLAMRYMLQNVEALRSPTGQSAAKSFIGLLAQAHPSNRYWHVMKMRVPNKTSNIFNIQLCWSEHWKQHPWTLNMTAAPFSKQVLSTMRVLTSYIP